MTIDLTQIILAIITLLGGILIKYVIPVLKQKTDENSRMLITVAINTAVYAAEQIYNSKQGQEKKEYVIKILAEEGFILDPDNVASSIDAMIEAAVKELNIKQQQHID